MNKKTLMLIIGWSALAAIIVLSLISVSAPSLDIPQQDKWHHLIAYGGLMFWFALIYHDIKSRITFLVLFFTVSGGLEIIQSLLPHRQGDWIDLIANLTGLIIGLLISASLIVLRKKPSATM